MAKFTLMQIQVPREELNQINELGWAEAMEKFPRVEASQAMRMGGSEAYVTEYDKLYTKVAVIEARDLEHAFLVHNNPMGSEELEALIERFGPQHSMSVGDLLIGEYGDVHCVDGFGFTQLMSANVAA